MTRPDEGRERRERRDPEPETERGRRPRPRAIPRGFTDKRNPMIAAGLAALLDRLPRKGPGAGPVPLLAVAHPSARPGDVEAFLDRPTWRLARKAPAVYEVEVLPDEVALLAGEPRLFRRLDHGTRLHGAAVPPDAKSAAIAVAVEDAAQGKARLKSLGFAFEREEPGPRLVGKLPAAALAELLTLPWATSVEVSPPS